MKVLKFGGTSVADSKSINNVISILKDNDEPLFIIVSAFGGITNLLQKCIVSKGKSVNGIINEIEQRHLEVINNLSSLDKQSSLKSFLKQNLNELEDILDAISTIDEVTEKTISKVLNLHRKLILQKYSEFSCTFVGNNYFCTFSRAGTVLNIIGWKFHLSAEDL